jgi:hypothetical protein
MKRIYWQVAGILFINFTVSYTVIYLLENDIFFSAVESFFPFMLSAPLFVLLYTVVNNLMLKVFSKWSFAYLFIGSFVGNLLYINSGYGGLLIFGFLFLIYLPLKEMVVPRFRYIQYSNLLTALILTFLFLLFGVYGLHSYIGLEDDWHFLHILQLMYVGVFHFIIVCMNRKHFSKRQN